MLGASIYKRNIIYFFTSFLWTATLSVLPQVFFMTNYPEYKNTFLSLFLLLGTLASIAGILTSQNNKFYSSVASAAFRRKLLTAICIFLMAATFSGLFLLKNLILYFACFILMKYISNLFYNYVDRLFVAGSNRQQLKTHVRANILFQLLGIMTAPLYFSVFAFKTSQNIFLVWLIAGLSLLFIFTGLEVSPDSKEEGQAYLKEKLSLYHRLFLAYALLVLTAVTMLTSMMIYILKDYYQFGNPAAKGGTIIGVISAFAVITVLISGAFGKSQSKKNRNENTQQEFATIPNGIIILVLTLMTLTLYAKIFNTFPLILGMCSFGGISYGIFLFSTRNYASSVSEKTELISVYNNLPNYAALLGYLLTLPLSLLAKARALDFSQLMLGCILAFFALSCLTIVLIIIENRTSKEEGDALLE